MPAPQRALLPAPLACRPGTDGRCLGSLWQLFHSAGRLPDHPTARPACGSGAGLRCPVPAGLEPLPVEHRPGTDQRQGSACGATAAAEPAAASRSGRQRGARGGRDGGQRRVRQPQAASVATAPSRGCHAAQRQRRQRGRRPPGAALLGAAAGGAPCRRPAGPVCLAGGGPGVWSYGCQPGWATTHSQPHTPLTVTPLPLHAIPLPPPAPPGAEPAGGCHPGGHGSGPNACRARPAGGHPAQQHGGGGGSCDRGPRCAAA